MAEPTHAYTPDPAADDTAVSRWFGSAFTQLQALHRRGGSLHGPLAIRFGRGLAGVVGRRLARRLGIPAHGAAHQLHVGIQHADGLLHWDRRFDDGARFASTFRPYGRWPDGGWIEDTGVIALRLQVDVVDGGWQWRCVGARLGRWPVPLWLLPRTRAGKCIEAGDYRFDVSICLPLLGEVLGYDGLLRAAEGDQ